MVRKAPLAFMALFCAGMTSLPILAECQDFTCESQTPSECLKLVLKRDRRHPEINLARANTFMNLERWTEASILLENALDMEPPPELAVVIVDALGKCAEHREGQVKLVSGQAMGNIVPYRSDVLRRIAIYWGDNNPGRTAVRLEISSKGKLLNCEILQSSGDAGVDDATVAAISSTRFAPLPQWYRGESIQFQINLRTVLAERTMAERPDSARF